MNEPVNVNPAATLNQNEVLTVDFTREELTVLNNILDVATRYEGLRIAETTLFLSKKIRDYLQVKNVQV